LLGRLKLVIPSLWGETGTGKERLIEGRIYDSFLSARRELVAYANDEKGERLRFIRKLADHSATETFPVRIDNLP